MQGRILAAIGAVLFPAISAASAGGEALVVRGKQRDWYFVDRAGVGRFGECIVAKELLPRLRGHEGKQLELEVTDVNQMFRPGLAVIKDFASVVERPRPPFSTRLWSRQSSEFPGSVDVYCTVTKSTEFPAGDDFGPHIDPWWGGFREVDRPGEVERYLDSGYTRRAMSFHGEYFVPLDAPARRIAGETIGRYVVMKPGESVTYLLERPSTMKGECEVGVRVSFRREGGDPIVDMARMPVELNARSAPPSEPRSRLRAEARLTEVGEWLAVDGRLFVDGESARTLVLRRGPDNCVPVGGLRVLDEGGREIPAKTTWHDWNHPGRLPVDEFFRPSQIDQEGSPFHFLVRWDDGFTRPAAKRLTMTILTEDGLETVSLAEAIPKLRPLGTTEFGDLAGGCRLRIRVERNNREVEWEPWTVHWEAVCEDGSSELLRIEPGDSQIILDGRKIGEVSSTFFRDFPGRSILRLGARGKLAPGKHALRMVIRGRGGMYTDLIGRQYRQFEGTVVSNEVTFVVEPSTAGRRSEP